MKLPDLSQLKTVSFKRFVHDFRRDVIRMMRFKFVCTAMCILITVFIVMLSSINMIMKTVSQSQSMTLLRQIAQSERYNSVESNNEDFRRFDGMQPPDGDMPLPDENMPPPGENDLPPDLPEGETMPARADGGSGFIAPLTFDGEEEYWGDWSGGRGRNRPGRQERDPEWETQNWQENDDRRPPDWEDWEFTEEIPSDFGGSPPPWETEEQLTEPPVMDTPAPAPTDAPTDAPAETDAETLPAAADPAEQPEPPPPVQEETDPPVPEEPPSEELSSEEETASETVPETETASSSDETETTTETTPPPKPSDDGGSRGTGSQFERRELRPDRWNINIIIDHFAIMADADGNFLGIRNTENYTDEEAAEIMNGILEKRADEGMYGWLQYCRVEKSYGTLMVVTDKTSDQGLLNNLFLLTVIIGIIMLAVLLAILIFLSRKITDPVEQTFVRQKQFVSDAGHELKTPIAVLTANADILQDEIGENKWLGYMQEQIGRMNTLVGDLLRLARMDNATQEYTFADFDLSLAVAATTLPFESAAFEQHKNLEMDVQPNVQYNGSEQHIRQLCAIFIDNALKYSNENGTIKVTLLKRGDQSILEFYNTGCEIGPSETEKIFERFYRGDKARNNQGKSGYGLGLAIAKSIMDVHKITIRVTCEQGKWIRFLLTL